MNGTYQNIDCMELMATLPDKSVDLAIVDPPYGIGEDGSNNHTRGKLALPKNYVAYSGNDKEPPSEEYFKELFRVSKNQVIFGANHYISRFGLDSSCWLVWDKDNGHNVRGLCVRAGFETQKLNYRWS